MAAEHVVDHTALSISGPPVSRVALFRVRPNNPEGLRLRSYLVDGEVRARFTPWPEHDNGLGYLNGGIIATVLDCHSAAAVLWEAHQRGWTPLAGAALSHVTAGLDVRFLRPSPLTETVDLRASVNSASESEITCSVDLSWESKVRAPASAQWNRWRSR